MNTKDTNLMQLEAVAGALVDLLPHVTFVGGSTTILLVDEAAHHGVRKTDDVDVIVDVASLVEYHKLSQRLRDLGFREDTDGPVCRWLFDTKTGTVKLDVMPIDETILVFFPIVGIKMLLKRHSKLPCPVVLLFGWLALRISWQQN